MSRLSSFLRTTTVVGLVMIGGTAAADPPVIPDPPAVFCFAKTGADQINGGNGIRIRFEILNWTQALAYGLRITANLNPIVSTGIDATATKMFGATTPAPLAVPFPPATVVNNWTVDSASTSVVTWKAGTPLAFDNPLLPAFPVGSGPNTLDGFILDLPYLSVFERVVFDWELLDAALNRLAPAVDPNGFAFGAFQIDRAPNGPNGEVRQSSFVTASFSSQGLNNPPPLDEGLTDQNATTDPATGVVPVPAAVWMLATALLGLFAGPWATAARRGKSGTVATA